MPSINIEAIAALIGIISVAFLVRESIWFWPTGFVQCLLYTFIFYDAKLYSDTILYVIYCILQLWGWYYWLYGDKSRTVLPITRLKSNAAIAFTALALGGTVLWGYLMASFTDASVPYGDAFTTVTSLVAQWLTIVKKLESWLFWIVADVAAICIYWYKALYVTSGLYLVFLILSVMGWFAWQKTRRDVAVSD